METNHVEITFSDGTYGFIVRSKEGKNTIEVASTTVQMWFEIMKLNSAMQTQLRQLDDEIILK